jgi:hypothetical protein
MPDWDVREFSRIAVFFQERKYYLRTQSDAQPPYRVRYELWPWPPERLDPPAKLITYDQAYVKERERDARDERRLQGLQYALYLLSPILGFLWAKTKERLCSHVGLNSRSLVGASLVLECLLALLWALFWSWSGGLATVIAGVLNSQLFSSWSFWKALLNGGALILIAIDCVLRLDQLLKEVESPSGFLEWLIRPITLLLKLKK